MKLKVIIISSLLVLASGMTARAQDGADSVALNASVLADQIIEEAKTHLGTPYVYGGKGPKSFDCSGFTRYVYAKFGYTLSPVATYQVGEGRRVSGHISNLQKGDLVFFSGRGGGSRVGHVGIYIEPDESGEGFRFIHAAVHGGIKISNVKESYYIRRFLGASRVIPDFGSRAVLNEPEVEPRLEPGKDYVVDIRDTLSLSENEYRVLLLADGKWVYVSPDGGVTQPDSTLRIVLMPDGKWTAADITKKQLPVIEEPAKVPAAPATASQPAVKAAVRTSPTSAKKSSGSASHTVKAGETLYSIAKKNGTTVDKIKKLNGLKSDNIQPGKKLRVK